MATRIRHIYPAPDIPSLHARSGRHPSEPIPARWLESLVQELRTKAGSEEEADSIVIHGFAAATATMTDVLTPEEQMRDELADLRAKLAAISQRLPREGEPADAATVNDLRRIAG